MIIRKNIHSLKLKLNWHTYCFIVSVLCHYLTWKVYVIKTQNMKGVTKWKN
jgi:hypothetical protein